MNLTRNFIFGVIAGLIFVSLIGFDLYRRLPTNANLANNPTLTTDSVVDADLPTAADPSPAPTITAARIPSSTPTPTPKPSLKPSPSPTPAPLIDYYLSTSSQSYEPEHKTGATEYVESPYYPQMRLSAEFGVNNAKVGDRVELKIYEDGKLQETRTQTVSSTTNLHFADVYHSKARNVGSHNVRFVYNENRKVNESNYGNNDVFFSFTILAEKEPPTFTIDGPYIINGQTCMRWINLVDNNSVYTDVWGKWKIDDGSWSSPTSENPYGCITAELGSTHTYYVHAEDFRGNVREDSRTFTAY